ncbi:MAG TPA: cytochrome C [Sphingobacteriaceae bacterium]|nr:cytochrome C [Sphingobacteriaceae bacterium]
MRSISLFFKSVAKSLLLIFSLSLAGVITAHAQDVAEGAALFKSNCTSCHNLDRKVVGPALKGVNDRHDQAWLLKWVKNSPAFIASGDAAAVKVFNENNKLPMTPFPTLTEGNILSILAYIKSEGDKPAAPAGGAAAGGTAVAAADTGVSDFMLIGLIVVIVVAFLIIFALNRVISTLESLLLRKPEIFAAAEEEEEKSEKDNFSGLKRLAKNKKFVFFVVILAMIFLGSATLKEMWGIGVREGYQPVQPIKFSHQLHAGTNQIDCQYCHSGAYKSKNASIPSLNVCMNCHNYVQATDKYDGQISPEIQKIYTALDYNPDTKVYGPNQKPVEWIRVHELPDFAYFNHSQHVSVAGIKCQKCHGPIETMQEVYQYSPLTMKWCINCHKETEVNSKGNAYYDKLIAAHDKLKKGEKITAAVLGGIECGKCHY